MLAAFGICAGLFIGVLSRGDLRSLAHAHVPGGVAMIALFVVQAVVRGPLLPYLGDFGVPLWGACLLVLLVVMWRNAVPAELWACGVGLASNLLVILLNGHMPVLESGIFASGEVTRAISRSDGFYQVANSATQLPWLGDVIAIGPGLASVGDLLLAVGVAAMIVRLMHTTPAEQVEFSEA